MIYKKAFEIALVMHFKPITVFEDTLEDEGNDRKN